MEPERVYRRNMTNTTNGQSFYPPFSTGWDVSSTNSLILCKVSNHEKDPNKIVLTEREKKKKT
jgi:hypothetical protein